MLSLRHEAAGAPVLGGAGLLFAGPVHPGLRLGSEWSYYSGSRVRFFQSFDAAFATAGVETSGGVTTDGGFSLRLVGPVHAETRLGLGLWWAQSNFRTFDGDARVRTGGFFYLAPQFRLGLSVTLPWWVNPELVAGYDVRMNIPLGSGVARPLKDGAFH